MLSKIRCTKMIYDVPLSVVHFFFAFSGSRNTISMTIHLQFYSPFLFNFDKLLEYALYCKMLVGGCSHPHNPAPSPARTVLYCLDICVHTESSNTALYKTISVFYFFFSVDITGNYVLRGKVCPEFYFYVDVNLITHTIHNI